MSEAEPTISTAPNLPRFTTVREVQRDVLDRASMAELISASRIVYAALNTAPVADIDEDEYAVVLQIDPVLCDLVAQRKPKDAEEMAQKVAYFLGRTLAGSMGDISESAALRAIVGDAERLASTARPEAVSQVVA